MLTINSSITEFAIIRNIQAGLARIPNDDFDNNFFYMTRESPEIWNSDRQNFIHNARPVPIHSHNDYWRRIPLFEALGSGCVSFEADVSLHNSDLLVGHTTQSLHSGSTLRSMYLEPLERMLKAQSLKATSGSWHGIYDRAPQQTVALLVDHKTAGAETFAALNAQLQPLRDLDFLTYWNGTDRVDRPLTIVASGNAPFESVVALDPMHRDIFWDAKLERLLSINDDFEVDPPRYGYNRSNSYFASTQWRNAKLYSYNNPAFPLPSTPAGKDISMSQIDQAKARGLVARYWDTPSGPTNSKDIVWRVLVEKKVGIINMDDLGEVRSRTIGWGNIEW